jgi:hypothetical protein
MYFSGWRSFAAASRAARRSSSSGSHIRASSRQRFSRAGDAMAEADGTFALSTYTANDGAPAGEYAVTVVWWKPLVDANGKPGPNLLPERYARPETTPLRATVKAGTNEVVLELKK